MCDLFLFIIDSNTANYAVNAVPYICNGNMNNNIKNIETEPLIIFLAISN